MTEKDYRKLHHDIREETTRYQLSYQMAETLFRSMEEIVCNTGDVLFDPGASESGIFVLVRGILRLYFTRDDKDLTFAFGLPGTFFGRHHTLDQGRPSPMGCAACTRDTLVLRISYENFERLMRQYPELLWWWMELQENQVYDLENCYYNKSGDAYTRFLALMNDRPEIMQACPMGTIASYLGITQSYLSQLRARWAHDREQNM